MATTLEHDQGTPAPVDDRTMESTGTVTVLAPAAELYRFWRDVTNIPRLLRRIQSVSVIDDRRSYWVALQGDDQAVGWDAMVTEDRPGEILAWESVADATVIHAGRVRFERAAGDRGTVVRLELRFTPSLAADRVPFAKLLGRDSQEQAMDALRRFRALIEAGEIPTVEGQPRGERSALGRRLSPDS